MYLAPFLNGNRYTSYGRHFTQVEKLEGVNYLTFVSNILYLMSLVTQFFPCTIKILSSLWCVFLLFFYFSLHIFLSSLAVLDWGDTGTQHKE